MIKAPTLARSLAPEDIEAGTYVMTLHRQSQVLLSSCNAPGPPQVSVAQVVTRPVYHDLPFKVIAICLPFVVVLNETKKSEILDTRSHRLAKVPKDFAKAALRSHLPDKDNKSKKGKKKGKGKKSSKNGTKHGN